MRRILLSLLLICLAAAPAKAVCTKHGTAGASSTQVVTANDTGQTRIYFFIQNSGTTNGMNVALGSSNAATTSDVYLGPGQSWIMTGQAQGSFATGVVPAGDVAVIQNGGSTTYAFCDY
jgi:hypothetical protein